MSLIKDAIIETIKRMPENTTAVKIIYELVIIDLAIKKLEKIGEDMTKITAEQLIKMIGRWSPGVAENTYDAPFPSIFLEK